MTHEEIEVRKAQIAELMNQPDADLDALEAEARDLNAQDEELRNAAAAAEEQRQQIAQGTAPVQIIEQTEQEETRMTYAIDTKEYRNAWLAAMQGKQVTAEERTALANGNYAIPTETVNKIYGKLELYPIMAAIDVMHIKGFVEIPVEGTINAANVVAMGNAATDSADTLGHVALAAYKLIKTVEITADVAAMAIDAFETWLVDRLANKIFRLAASLVAAGSGTNTITGLTSISATGNTYTKTGLTYTDLMTIIAALPAEYLPNATFVMSRQVFFGQVLGMTTTAGEPVVVADRQSPAKYSILGWNVILEDALNTTGSIVFGDLKEGYVFNFAQDVTVEADRSVGFRSGSVVYRGMALADGKPTGVGLVRFVPAP